MTPRSNLHTHTTYCHGENTAREMAQAAVEKGMHALGFSGHAYTYFDTSYCMSLPGTQAYREEILRLKAEYAGRLDIYLGLENDAGDPQDTGGFDYIIGSSHYLSVGGRQYSVDHTPEETRACMAACGGAAQMARAYYGRFAEYVLDQKPDIAGHFDVITKFDGWRGLFDANDPAYRAAALEAITAIAECGTIVEVNTGAMARGYTKAPYPAPFLLKRLLELKAPVILSSDAHSADMLDAHFADARALLLHIGFREIMEYTPNGFVSAPL